MDLTEAFDAIRFNDRIILLTLYATGEYDAQVSAFVNAVHGKRMQIVFSKDPDYYYTGRVDVTSISKRDGYCEIAITITAEPFKMDSLVFCIYFGKICADYSLNALTFCI